MDNHHGLILDANKLHERLRLLGVAWADADAAYKALEDATKTILADAFLSSEGSVAEREARSRTTDDYREHLAALGEARKAMNTARVNYDVARVYVDLERTNAAAQRALVDLR